MHMQLNPLGRSSIKVSAIGLGTMTWGQQNSEADAHQQMDYAVAQGVNLLDAAEMYPVPPLPETQGLTERYIGSWLQKSGQRHNVVIATKVTGPGVAHIRDGAAATTAQSIRAACDASLERLQTDYIDLYQVHWPARATNYFGKLGYPAQAALDKDYIHETLEALADLMVAGKVRAIGISNETAWGAAEYLRLSRERLLPRIVTIQNPYSLLNRSYEVGLAEFATREDLGLLAYSPLAFGKLSGKYRNGAAPADGRLSLFSRFQRYNNPQADAAVDAYAQLAEQHGLSLASLALAFINSRSFITSNLVGATTMAQLRENIASASVTLSDALLAQIDVLHQRHTIPCP